MSKPKWSDTERRAAKNAIAAVPEAKPAHPPVLPVEGFEYYGGTQKCTCVLCTTGRIFTANKKRLPKDVWAAINTLNTLLFEADMDCAKEQVQSRRLFEAVKTAHAKCLDDRRIEAAEILWAAIKEYAERKNT